MDEIDEIIIKALKGVGCEIGGEIVNLSFFSPDLVVETVSKCLRIINPTIFVPKSSSSIITHRYSVASSLVEACISIGYKNDIGYHTFLYSNVPEIRKLYMFLIEMLPKENLAKYECKRLLAINLQINSAFSTPWTPHCCRIRMPKKMQDCLSANSKERLNCWLKRSLNHSPLDFFLCASPVSVINFKSNNANMIIEWNKFHKSYFTTVLNKSKSCLNQTTNKKILSTSGEVNENNNVLQTKKQIDTLKNNINKNKTLVKSNFSNQKDICKKITEISDLCGLKQKSIEQLKYEKKLFQRVNIVLDNYNENIKKMETLVDAIKQKKQSLTIEWENSRLPLIQAIETLETSKDVFTKIKCVRKKLRSIHEQSIKIKEEIQIKSIMYSVFSQELKELDAYSQRFTYISRIMEIIENIKKQNNDIQKVIKDTNEVKKRITAIAGILDRQFTITDDAIYSIAKKNEHIKKAYKLLAALHLYCSELIMLVQMTGSVMREVRELEENIEQEKLKNVSTNLKKIKNDFIKIEKEKLLTTNKINNIKFEEEQLAKRLETLK